MPATGPPSQLTENPERPQRRPWKPPRRADEEISYATRAHSHLEASTVEQSEQQTVPKGTINKVESLSTTLCCILTTSSQGKVSEQDLGQT